MLADPFVTNNSCSAATYAGSLSLPTISRGDSSSAYRLLNFNADGSVLDMFVGHQYAKRNRTTLKFTVSNVVPDPLVTGVSSLLSNSYYVVADESPIYKPATRAQILTLLGIAVLTVGAGVPTISRALAGET